MPEEATNQSSECQSRAVMTWTSWGSNKPFLSRGIAHIGRWRVLGGVSDGLRMCLGLRGGQLRRKIMLR
jgi:hypothetical protein